MSDIVISVAIPPQQAQAGSKTVVTEVKMMVAAGKQAKVTYEALGKELGEYRREAEKAAMASRSLSASAGAKSYTQKGPSFGDKANDFVGGLTGGLGPAAAITGATMAIDQGLKSLDAYNLKLENAQNSLVRFFGTQEKAAQMLPQFQQLQYNLNASLEETVNAFDAVEGATKNLGLSTQQQIAITRNLSQAMIVDGKAIGDVSGVIERLEFALDKGSISSGELAKIMKAFPPLAEQWRAEFGMSNAELLKAADNGKLVEMGLERLVTTYQKTGGATKQFEERLVTLTDLQRAAGGEDAGLISLTIAYDKHVDAMQAAKDETLDMTLKLKGLTDELVAQHRQLEVSTSKFVGLAASIGEVGLALNSKVGMFFHDPWGDSFFDKGLKAIGITDKYAENLRNAANKAKQAREEAEKLAKAIFSLKQDKPGSNNAEWEKEKAARERAISLDTAFSNFDNARFPSMMGGSGGLAGAPKIGDGASDPGAMTDLTRKWREELGKTTDSLAAINEIGTAAFGSIQSSIEQLVTTGKFSWKDMINSMIADLGRLATQKLFMSLISGLGGLGSTTTLAPGVAPLPGGGLTGLGAAGATGGDWMTMGGGSTDSRVAMIKYTPGESIHVRTPEQRSMTAQSGGSSRPVKVVNMPTDRRALLQDFDSREGDEVILNAIARRASSVRSLLG